MPSLVHPQPSTESAPAPVPLTLRFALSHPAHLLALGGGTGLSPWAPGTVGTALAVPIHALLLQAVSVPTAWCLVFVFFVAGVWACARTGRDLGVADHGGMNWDETVAFLGVLVFTGDSWLWGAIGFGLFRFFDIVKPPPVGAADRHVKGGLGVMLDDALAALCTVLVLRALQVSGWFA